MEEALIARVLLLAERRQGLYGIPDRIGHELKRQALVLQGGGVLLLERIEDKLALLLAIDI